MLCYDTVDGMVWCVMLRYDTLCFCYVALSYVAVFYVLLCSFPLSCGMVLYVAFCCGTCVMSCHVYYV
jgi:predicted membrane metal-binding protein